tara:strand:- start:379 stop:603 length:225 start_codon:yes stop_codon:yes gene_type:complete
LSGFVFQADPDCTEGFVKQTAESLRKKQKNPQETGKKAESDPVTSPECRAAGLTITAARYMSGHHIYRCQDTVW